MQFKSLSSICKLCVQHVKAPNQKLVTVRQFEMIEFRLHNMQPISFALSDFSPPPSTNSTVK